MLKCPFETHPTWPPESPGRVGLKLHEMPYWLTSSPHFSLKLASAGSTISGAKGSEATPLHGVSVPSSGP